MLALLQEVPVWLQKTEAWAIIFQAVLTPLLIVTGGLFAWYKFFRQGEHDPRLQPTVTGTATVHCGVIHVVATVRAQNTGQVDVNLDLESSGLDICTTKTGDNKWTHRHIVDVFANHGLVQPAETIEDQVWFEIPYDDEVGIKLDLSVAPAENRSYPTTEIISLLPEKGGNQREGG